MKKQIEIEKLTTEQLAEWDRVHSQLELEGEAHLPFRKHTRPVDRLNIEEEEPITSPSHSKDQTDLWEFCGVEEVRECRK